MGRSTPAHRAHSHDDAARRWAILVESGPHDQFWTVAIDTGALVTFTQDKSASPRATPTGAG